MLCRAKRGKSEPLCSPHTCQDALMTIPCIYADFNAVLCAKKREGTSEVEMPITGYGTLQSLAQQGIRLTEGMPLLLFEPGDIQCEAFAHFDDQLTDPAGRVGAWVAVLNLNDVQDSTMPWPSDLHPCISCGADLRDHLRTHGSGYVEHCPRCDASVMEPMAPPR